MQISWWVPASSSRRAPSILLQSETHHQKHASRQDWSSRPSHKPRSAGSSCTAAWMPSGRLVNALSAAEIVQAQKKQSAAERLIAQPLPDTNSSHDLNCQGHGCIAQHLWLTSLSQAQQPHSRSGWCRVMWHLPHIRIAGTPGFSGLSCRCLARSASPPQERCRLHGHLKSALNPSCLEAHDAPLTTA